MNETIILLMPDLDNDSGMLDRIEGAYNSVLSYVGTRNSINKLGAMPDYPLIHYRGLLTDEDKENIKVIVSGIASPIFIEGCLNILFINNTLNTIEL